jgi:hypothetical protein
MSEDIGPWGRDQLMVVSAFRYCLGRRSYVVSDCCEWIVAKWPEFADHTKALIHAELEEAFVNEKRRMDLGLGYGQLGMEMDRAEWERVRKLWSET